MPHPPDITDAQLWLAWRDAARDPRIDAALRALFDQLTDDIVQRSPTCWLSGRCCNFEKFGHRLYVTGLETAWLVNQLDDVSLQRLHDADPPSLEGCPFQIEKLCTVHALRPLGCRIFFCDPNAADWQNPVYETFLTRLRDLHETHAIEYRYLEWRTALRDARDQRA